MLHPRVNRPDNRQQDKLRLGGLSETPNFCGTLPFRQVTQASGYHRKWSVCEAYTRTGVAYAGRTLYTALSRAFSLAVSFLASFSVDLVVHSRISSFPRILGLSESRRQSPGGTAWMETFPSGLSDPLVVRLVHFGWKPFHFISGSTSTRQSRQELLGFAVQPGPLFFLDFVVYASCSSSSGALRQLPWGTQGFFYDTQNKRFSFRKEVRSWSRSC